MISCVSILISMISQCLFTAPVLHLKSVKSHDFFQEIAVQNSTFYATLNSKNNVPPFLGHFSVGWLNGQNHLSVVPRNYIKFQF